MRRQGQCNRWLHAVAGLLAVLALAFGPGEARADDQPVRDDGATPEAGHEGGSERDATPERGVGDGREIETAPERGDGDGSRDGGSPAAVLEGAEVPAEVHGDGGQEGGTSADAVEDADGEQDSVGPAGDLERARVELALARLGLREEGAPEGLEICAIHVVTEDIFVEDEAFPTWPNVFHRTTREGTVRRALTFREGDRWRAVDMVESEEELRGRYVYSAVAVVPVEAAGEECVGVLVLTRDRWSLQMGWDLTTAGSSITALSLSAQESNFLGRNVGLSMNVGRTPGGWTVGPSVWVPSWGRSRLRFREDFRLVLGPGGELEGTASSFRLERPLRSVRDRWGWSVGVDHVHRVERLFVGEELRVWESEGGEWALAERWRRTGLSGFGVGTHGWGEAVRQTMSAGAFLRLNVREVMEEDVEGVPSEVVAQFREERMPRDERSLGPLWTWSVVESRFLRLQNVGNYGVTESFRLGGRANARLEVSERLLGADRRYVRPSAGFGGTFALGEEAFVRGDVSAGTFVEEGVGVENVGLAWSVRGVTPEWFAGRMHGLVRLRLNWRTRTEVVEVVGANTGVRGLPEGWIRARDVGLGRWEWRSRPLRLWQTRMGGVVFADGALVRGGDVVESWRAWGSVGVGGRLRVPQFMSTVLAVDAGWPLVDGRRVEVGSTGWLVPAPLLSVSLGQAF